MTTSRAYDTLLTRVSLRKLNAEGKPCGTTVAGYEFEPPTRGLPYIVYFPGGNVFRTSHVEDLVSEGGDVIIRTQNSTYAVAYPHGNASKTFTDLDRIVGAKAGRWAVPRPNVTATQEIPARRIAIRAVERSGGWSEEEELTGWEAAPPQEGEPYITYLERGGILQTSTVQEVQETDGGIFLRTRNSLYQVRYLGAMMG